MTTITFDTLEFTEQLKAAGVPEEQARGHAKALTAVMRQTETHIDERIEKRDKQSEEILDGMATRGDFKELDAKIESVKFELKHDIKELELRMAAEIAPLKWGMAVCVGGIIALILKSFFPH
ncbi:MAG: CCDC90 family protein [Magnetococcus sp. XQGC-1]